MQKLSGHWTPIRSGIIEHFKNMTLSEIVLFITYTLLANKETWECWRTIRQLEQLLPMTRRTILYAKRKLIQRGWIQKRGHTGIYIPKLYRYRDKVQNEQQKVQNEQHSSDPYDGEKVQNEQQKVQKMTQAVQNEQQKVQNAHPIIEDDIIIEDDYLLGRPQKTENTRLCKLSEQERLHLSLLKSIPGYPFDFEKDLSFFRDLLIDFPTIDITEELKKWKTWLLDKNFENRKKKVNYRLRLRRWLTNALKYQKQEHKIKDKETNHGEDQFDPTQIEGWSNFSEAEQDWIRQGVPPRMFGPWSKKQTS